VTFNTHSRPIPSPVHDLRPARDTCEQCTGPRSSTATDPDRPDLRRRRGERRVGDDTPHAHRRINRVDKSATGSTGTCRRGTASSTSHRREAPSHPLRPARRRRERDRVFADGVTDAATLTGERGCSTASTATTAVAHLRVLRRARRRRGITAGGSTPRCRHPARGGQGAEGAYATRRRRSRASRTVSGSSTGPSRRANGRSRPRDLDAQRLYERTCSVDECVLGVYAKQCRSQRPWASRSRVFPVHDENHKTKQGKRSRRTAALPHIE